MDLCRGESFGFLGFDFRRMRSGRMARPLAVVFADFSRPFVDLGPSVTNFDNGLVGIGGLTLGKVPFVIPPPENEFMSRSVPGPSTKPRGTALLEAFEDCLPNFNSLDEEQHLQFVKAIRLLSDHFKLSESRLERESWSQVQPTIHHLRQLYDQYLDKNTIIASAIFIVITHIESYYIDDRDSKLVHNLTGLHIYPPIQWLGGDRTHDQRDHSRHPLNAPGTLLEP